MNRQNGKRWLVERVKDVLILALACSAVWLALRSQMFHPVSQIWQEEEHLISAVETESVARVDAARPLRMAASLTAGTESVRYGVQYDTEESDALFQQAAGLLAEALSSAEEPVRVTRAQWEQALLTAPGICFDFQGELPMSVLAGWLTGEEKAPEAVVRRMALTVWQEEVALYYRDEAGGGYFRCLSEVADQSHLAQTLSELGGNGAGYAFESEEYAALDPDTLLTRQELEAAVYDAANPMSGGRNALEGLMEMVGLPVDASSFYSSGNEQVARNGDDSLRLSDRGVAEYQAGEESEHFYIPIHGQQATLFEAVEACRQLTAATIGANCGQARTYLLSAQDTGDGLDIRFGYCLNGSVVRQEQGYAARFLVRNGQITQFELRFRSYTDSGETTPVLPIRQAAAAQSAMGLEGEELLLAYNDTGADRVTAAWVAADRGAAEEG